MILCVCPNLCYDRLLVVPGSASGEVHRATAVIPLASGKGLDVARGGVRWTCCGAVAREHSGPRVAKLNLRELVDSLGRPLSSIADVVAAGGQIVADGAQAAVVTLGARGGCGRAAGIDRDRTTWYKHDQVTGPVGHVAGAGCAGVRVRCGPVN
ncbi:MAG TPA: hypothetical protein VNN19_07160 [bacterium]|nr:hypothetical protein [bacterium]